MVNYVSIRGNIKGISEKEGTPEHIKNAIKEGFYVLIDVIHENNILYSVSNSNKYVIDDTLAMNKFLFYRPLNNEGIVYCIKHSLNYTMNKENEMNFSNGQIIITVNDQTEEYLKSKDFICSNHISNISKKLSAKNRYAIFLMGRVTTYEENLMNKINNFYKHNLDDYIDFFVHVNIKELDEYHKNFINDVYPTSFKYKDYICDNKYITHKNVREETRVAHNGLYKLMSMYNSYNEVGNQFEEYTKINKINWNLCCLFRTDIINDNFPPFNGSVTLNKDTLYSPYYSLYFHYKWKNPMVSISDYDTMIYVLKLYKKIDEYIYVDNVKLHGESLFTHHTKHLTELVFNYDIPLDIKRWEKDPYTNKNINN